MLTISESKQERFNMIRRGALSSRFDKIHFYMQSWPIFVYRKLETSYIVSSCFLYTQLFNKRLPRKHSRSELKLFEIENKDSTEVDLYKIRNPSWMFYIAISLKIQDDCGQRLLYLAFNMFKDTSFGLIVLKWNRINLIGFQEGIYLLRVNNRNTRGRCEICSELTIKTPERCH